ncbi:MAG: hypothetical protein WC915_05415 [archaeon]
MRPLKKREVQGTFSLFNEVRVRNVRHVGQVGESIITDFIKGKTPAQISSKSGHSLEVVLGVIEKVTNQKIKPNAQYLPFEKRLHAPKRLHAFSGRGHKNLYEMIEHAKVRDVDVNAIMQRLITPITSVYELTQKEINRRRENEIIQKSLEPGKRKQELEERHKEHRSTRIQRAAIKAIEFVISYPHLPTKIKSFEGTMKTKGFVSVKDLTEYLIHLNLSKADNPRKYASTVIMRLEEEGIIERVPPGGIMITPHFCQK